MKNPEKLLDLLSQDARLSTAQLAAMTGSSEDEVVSQLKHYEKNGTILGYKALVDWDKTDRESVTALIEVKITPQKGMGFDEIAQILAYRSQSHFSKVFKKHSGMTPGEYRTKYAQNGI